jgi:hypothetical protein
VFFWVFNNVHMQYRMNRMKEYLPPWLYASGCRRSS